ncbi:relaxase/mobilization nuclease domain-containing protein, partial [Staphylococcus epidermidis]|uniref:relaxase/mobilization nuclease domain-containing protein n=1 Tax=Staphylococcus epidermidis TaxID=1282 RepID=UPI00164331D2
MPTTKLPNTKSPTPPINYPQNPPQQKSPLNSHIHYTKSSFKQTPALYPKHNPLQPHTLIQSFNPPKLTPDQSNQFPLQFPQNIPPNHQLPLYTHPHTNHLHNHILINSIHLQTPKKYQTNKKQTHFLKQKNHQL